jgi:plasmid maintenance system antidote protein VapI
VPKRGPYLTYPPGVFILEELAFRNQTVEDLRSALGCSLPECVAYLEGKRSILPVAQILARFFGTSVTLWNHLWNTWEKRSTKRSLTVSEGQTAPEVQG